MSDQFIDSNVLIYLASNDLVKANRAEEILRGGGTISVQVLNEITQVLRRKLRFSWPETHDFLAPLRALLDVCPLSLDMHTHGLDLAERYGFSIYDAMIVSAGLGMDCDILYSEDMQDGMLIEGQIRIINPFNN